MHIYLFLRSWTKFQIDIDRFRIILPAWILSERKIYDKNVPKLDEVHFRSMGRDGSNSRHFRNSFEFPFDIQLTTLDL